MASAIVRAFTPSSGPPPGSAANPLPLPPGTQTDPAGNIHLPQTQAQSSATQVQQAPPLPQQPAAPTAPPMFQPGASPGAKQRAQIAGTSILGAAAATGQTARRSATVLG